MTKIIKSIKDYIAGWSAEGIMLSVALAAFIIIIIGTISFITHIHG